jgi:hypothetical protein
MLPYTHHLDLHLANLPTYSLLADSRTKDSQIKQPNLFEFKTKDNQIKINYSTTSLNGLPRLTYQTSQKTLNFSGDAIRSVDTEIGQMVTILIEVIPDARSTTLTLLLPTVNLPAGAKKNQVQTKAILTTSRSSIGGPKLVQGQVQSYQVIDIEGTASLVNF